MQWAYIIMGILVIPNVLAAWQIYISPGWENTTIYGYADKHGCVSVVTGKVYSVKYFVGDEIQELSTISDHFCVPDDTVFTATSTSDVTLAIPKSSVQISESIMSGVDISDFGTRTMVSVRTYYSTAGALLLIALAGIIAYLMLLRNRKKDYSSTEDRIIEYVSKNPGCTQKDICSALGLEKYQVSRILSRLEQRGRIVRIKRGISKRVYLPEQLR